MISLVLQSFWLIEAGLYRERVYFNNHSVRTLYNLVPLQG
jgi:hypothetical protein